MIQKVIKIGSSIGITIPKDSAKRLRIKAGDQVEISAYPSSSVLTVRLGKATRDVNPDVITWTNAFIDKNRRLLERLAEK